MKPSGFMSPNKNSSHGTVQLADSANDSRATGSSHSAVAAVWNVAAGLKVAAPRESPDKRP